jgi:hypothetical protein
VLVLVHSSPKSLLRDHGRHPNLGVLASPRCVYADDIREWPWAADNDAYSDWNEGRFLRMLGVLRDRPGSLFVVAPDVVGDAAATLERFRCWRTRMEGLPLAFVAQDGLTPALTPWDDFGTLFVGGTSAWKLGEAARAVAVEAKRRGKWLHMGRVNTQQRLLYAHSLGCDSIDGTNFSMYRRTNLPWALDMCAQPRQAFLPASEPSR